MRFAILMHWNEHWADNNVLTTGLAPTGVSSGVPAAVVAASGETKTSIVSLSKKDLATYIVDRRRQTIQMICIKLEKGREINEGYWRDLAAFFGVLNNIEMTPELKQATRIDEALLFVFANARFRYPEPYPTKAKELYELWEAQNWGAGEIEEDSDEEATPDEAETTQAEESSGPTIQPSHSQPAGAQASGPVQRLVREPDLNHRIFGANGIMRGILIVQGRIKAYKLHPTAPRANAKVYGHNNLQIGSWWPMQIAALRDGAHGARMGGIAGNATFGAYSIVVSGAYDLLDNDFGDRLYYSGSSSHENKDPNKPVISTAAMSLRRSISTGKPVRVLRSGAGQSQYCPSVGLRYDGLYTVTAECIAKNSHGGAYVKFKLERNRDQGPIVLDRPTLAEKNAFEKVANGY